MIERLKLRHYRLTPQRLAVLNILAGRQTHPSADQIHRQVKKDFPTTSLATVYKIIGVLKEMNQVLELGLGDGRNRYDAVNPKPHPHLICIHCKEIIDPDLPGLGEMTSSLSAETGFQILNHRLDFYGLCPGCQDTS